MRRLICCGFKVATWPIWVVRWLEEPIPDENDWSFL